MASLADTLLVITVKKTTMYIPQLEDIKAAAVALKKVAAVTPITESLTISKAHQANIFLKREDLQQVRSYKIRGAYNKMRGLSPSALAKGVVCASAGNHAQGVAFSCKLLKTKGVIYMPTPTPKQKLEQVKMFGEGFVEIVLIGDTFDDAKNEALKYCKELGTTFIHPFDDEKVIEGQATVGLEIIEQLKVPIDYLFLPVGGGGLAAGVSRVFHLLSPNTKIIGVEPKGAPSLSVSLQNKRNTKIEHIEKFVDGAAVQQVGDLNFDICQVYLNEVVTVDEGKICETILKLYNKDAIVVEPAGALALAALDQFHDRIAGKNVVCVVSGSNNDITRTEEIRERALLYEGLKHYFIVKFPQRAGALKEFVADVLGPTDDITHFEYTKKNARERGAAVVGIELKNAADFEQLRDRMILRNFYGDYLNDKPDLLNLVV